MRTACRHDCFLFFLYVFGICTHISLLLNKYECVRAKRRCVRACYLGVFKYVLTFAAKNATRSLSIATQYGYLLLL